MEGITKLVRICYPQQNVAVMSREQMIKDIERAILHEKEVVKAPSQDDSKKKAKELKD